MKKIFIGFTTPLLLLASGDAAALLPMLLGVVFVIVLFFWGIYKLIKTQKNIYILALLPFVLLIGAMFIR